MTYELIPLMPLGSFLILGLFGHWIKDKAHLVAVPAVVLGMAALSVNYLGDGLADALNPRAREN